MKKILITGANSYIGTSFENYMQQWSDQYQVDTIDMIDGSWRKKDFSFYDVVFHVAGIAHVRETKKNAELYYFVNRDLAIVTAEKAKKDGAKQFIFLSSMSVYGMETGVITKETVPNPKTNYGKAKLQAEIELGRLSNDIFTVSIIRPPMVYGKGCKGNYQTLSKWAQRLPVFPNIRNERSMIYIDNLSACVQKIINNESSGLFFPQDKDYVCTSNMVKQIADESGHKIHLTKIFNWAICLMKIVDVKYINKVFGNLVYEKSYLQ